VNAQACGTAAPGPVSVKVAPMGQLRWPVSSLISRGRSCSSVVRGRFQVAKYRVSLRQPESCCRTRTKGDVLHRAHMSITMRTQKILTDAQKGFLSPSKKGLEQPCHCSMVQGDQLAQSPYPGPARCAAGARPCL